MYEFDLKNLPDEFVFFLEGNNQPEVNQAIKENYLVISRAFKSHKNKLLLYHNGLTQYVETFKQDYKNHLEYHFPYLTIHEIGREIETISALLSLVPQSADVNRVLQQALGVPLDRRNAPCFAMRRYGKNEFYFYNHEEYNNATDWGVQIANKQDIYFDISDFDGEIPPYDPDYDDQYQRISNEIEAKIKLLGEAKAYDLMAKLLISLAKESGLEEAELRRMVGASSTLSKRLESPNETVKRLSRLVIDSQHRILLPDYHNIEIKMPTLSKVLYFLYLRHPEGLLFKQLQTHWLEAHWLYFKITNRTDTDELKRSMSDLLNPTSNSVHEKCSRIKEAFVSVIDDDIAQYYYITGKRGQPKQIKLPRELVQLPW
ncbi:hypothetical protein SAMN05660226_01985 [Parapedobacter luteus]|uniref:Uncharacterized protein n=1 Tax=Parapedobacter luteus TaxID=623280 RepID=A0A1T5C9A0_9SPHI|nr:hypothetical protein [Parapedobacter luteus]SKB56028.1 hypothetical protein SAMN05660226_01985 [Parapedobacter luteus]